VTAKPVARHHELTEPQKKHQRKFQHAILYGKSANANPALKEQYQAKAGEGESAFNVAVADYMNAPDIENIDVTKYTGQAGSTILIEAIDDFMVVEVQVEIYNNEGTLVEQGNAVQQDIVTEWLFTATVSNGSIAGDKIIVKAFDLPGNLTEKESIM
jgi:hypothetical protein